MRKKAQPQEDHKKLPKAKRPLTTAQKVLIRLLAKVSIDDLNAGEATTRNKAVHNDQ